MFRRSLSPQTVEFLKRNRLWQNLCADRDLQPEIRDDAVTVYYRGGALLRNLRVIRNSLLADVQPKYVPIPGTHPGTGTAETDWFYSSLAELPDGSKKSRAG